MGWMYDSGYSAGYLAALRGVREMVLKEDDGSGFDEISIPWFIQKIDALIAKEER